MITVELYIKGNVQGVFYRASARDKAVELNIKGTIENLADGNVKAIITGEEHAINEFVAWCKEGPPRAAVDGVIVTPMETQEFEEFRIVRN